MTYVKTQDPLRVNEAAVREFIAQNPKVSVGTILTQGRFSPGGSGTYAAVTVIVKSSIAHRLSEERQYSTHLAIVRSEDPASGSVPQVILESGHYGLTWAEAVADLAER